MKFSRRPNRSSMPLLPNRRLRRHRRRSSIHHLSSTHRSPISRAASSAPCSGAEVTTATTVADTGTTEHSGGFCRGALQIKPEVTTADVLSSQSAGGSITAVERGGRPLRRTLPARPVTGCTWIPTADSCDIAVNETMAIAELTDRVCETVR